MYNANTTFNLFSAFACWEKMRSNQFTMYSTHDDVRCTVYLDEKIFTFSITNTNISAFLRKQNRTEIGQKE